jgi:hypothetical protein
MNHSTKIETVYSKDIKSHSQLFLYIIEITLAALGGPCLAEAFYACIPRI